MLSLPGDTEHYLGVCIDFSMYALLCVLGENNILSAPAWQGGGELFPLRSIQVIGPWCGIRCI